MLYLYPHIEQGDGNGGCGQFLMLPLPLLYPQGEDFSHSSSAPSCGSSYGRQFTTSYNTTPSHRIRFFISCSSLGPFHGVQLLRIRLLQHGSSMESGPASTPAPAWTPQVLPGAWSNAGFPVGHSILHASTCSRIYQGAVHGLFMGSRVTACHTVVFCTNCRGVSALALEHLLPLLLH